MTLDAETGVHGALLFDLQDSTDYFVSAGGVRSAVHRLAVADLPANSLGLWRAGDFVLANERVALLIEDVGASDLYDPWGGRPLGVARVQDGALVGAADFGEFFILTGRNSLVTTTVGVIADGSDGGPAIVRAVGVLQPTPFFEAIVGGIFRDTFEDIPTAIDYVLEPGADHVDIRVTYHSLRPTDSEVPTALHGYMFNYRNGRYAPGYGFDTDGWKHGAYQGELAVQGKVWDLTTDEPLERSDIVSADRRFAASSKLASVLVEDS